MFQGNLMGNLQFQVRILSELGYLRTQSVNRYMLESPGSGIGLPRGHF